LIELLGIGRRELSKRSASGALLTILALCTVVLAFDTRQVRGATIIVPDDYPTIQEAINQANDGDTVFVKNGTYLENVVVNRSISLIGENPETTIIDGQEIWKEEVIPVRVIAEGVVVSGFTLQRGWAGITLENDSAVVSNNIIIDSWNGLRAFPNTTNHLVVNNTFTLFLNDDLRFWTYGILLMTGTSNNTIRQNVLNIDPTFGWGFVDGIYLDGSDNNKIECNSVDVRCLFPGGGAMTIKGGNNEVLNNTFRGRGGLGMLSGEGNLIRNNKMTANYGISLAASKNVLVENTVEYSYEAIMLDPAANNSIYHNNFYSLNNNTWINENFPFPNFWDNGYPSGGNYWSSYVGVDNYGGPRQNESWSDGFGDTPYKVNATSGNVDHYPLMKPYAGPHDIGIASFTSKTAVGQGFSVNMSLKTVNYGEQTETFDVTIRINSAVMLTQTIVLDSRRSNVTTLVWNTSGYPKGNYTIDVHASSVPNETDTADNSWSGRVVVAMIGDITGPSGYPDGKVDARDVARICSLFGTKIPDPKYDPNWDLTGSTEGLPDGKIDARDVSLVSSKYGEKDS
jgi:nitrous oxidase accessory protein NosD